MQIFARHTHLLSKPLARLMVCTRSRRYCSGEAAGQGLQQQIANKAESGQQWQESAADGQQQQLQQQTTSNSQPHLRLPPRLARNPIPRPKKGLEMVQHSSQQQHVQPQQQQQQSPQQQPQPPPQQQQSPPRRRTRRFGAPPSTTTPSAPPASQQNSSGHSDNSSSGSTAVGTSNTLMRQLADRNHAAAEAAAAAAAAAGQHPQLRSLLTESSWARVLAPQFDQPYMQQLQVFLQQEWGSQVVYPPQQCIFRALNSVPLDKVRVVILGQDPYINAGEAMGLSFSVPPGIKMPKSLVNIFQELHADVGASIPRHGCLRQWSDQGVLLLNAVLTVRAGSSNSHQGRGWEQLTSAVLEAVVQQRQGVVFILWGNYAQARCAKLDMSRHHVLKGVHPSPLAAHRGFFGCRHFSAANNLLVQSGQEPIDWQIS